MNRIQIPHPLNPNLKLSFNAPLELIGGGVEVDDVKERLERLIAVVTDEKTREAFETGLDDVASEKNEAVRLLRYYILALQVAGEIAANMSGSEIENSALKVLYRNESLPGRRFGKLPDDNNNNNNDVVVKDINRQSEYELIRQKVFNLTKPLHDFVGMLDAATGGGDPRRHYVWKDGNMGFVERRSPVLVANINDEKSFREWNQFLGKEVLDALFDANRKEMTPEDFWKNVDYQVFAFILAQTTLGAVNLAWNSLGRKFGGFKPYIYSDLTRANFARLTAMMLLGASGGNAYPARLTGGRMTYFISAGIKTRNGRRLGTLALQQWFEGIRLDKDGLELKK